MQISQSLLIEVIQTLLSNFKDDLTAKKYDECNITLEIIRSDNANKLCSFKHKFC